MRIMTAILCTAALTLGGCFWRADPKPEPKPEPKHHCCLRDGCKATCPKGPIIVEDDEMELIAPPPIRYDER
jgi:hypothetical protein